MRYVVKLEAIGDNHVSYLRHFLKAKPSLFGRRELDAIRFGTKKHVPWIAKIIGVRPDGFLRREFVDGQRDYSQANSVGSRGIYLYYALRPGLYEINSPETWKRVRRYFVRVVDEKTLEEISREELIECFKSVT